MTQTTPTVAPQTKPLAQTDAEIVARIRERMQEDGRDWQTELPTQRLVAEVAIAHALASGAEKATCASERARRLRTLTQTADLGAPTQTGPVRRRPAPPDPEPTPEPSEPGLPQTTEPAPRRELPDQQPETPDQPEAPTAGAPAPAAERRTWLRFVPPVASLGLSAIMQVIIVTDVLGHALIARYDQQGDNRGALFLVAFLFGLGIACAVEGAAAYLLDLYRKHLLARDSVFTLRLLLVGYVAGSAALIHWWTGNPQIEPGKLPGVLATVLSVLAGSSILLWVMGSKWENRVQMKLNGQLDPAMPRVAAAAKVFHPVRWLQLLALTSWDPAQTTAEARDRHRVWSEQRKADQTARQTRKSADK